MATNNIQEIQQWCEIARKLLKTTKILGRSSDNSEALKKYINSIAKELQKLTADTGLAKVYTPLLEEFNQLSIDMKAEAKNINTQRGKDNKKKEEIQTELNEKFKRLETKVKAKLPVIEAKQKYTKAYEKTKLALELLEVTPYANCQEIRKVLNNIHQLTDRTNEEAFNTGLESLVKLDKEIESEKKAATERGEQGIKQGKMQPECGVKLEEARNRLSEIEELVGVEPVAKQYREIIFAAEELCKTGNYLDAINKLKELESQPKLVKIKETSDNKKLGLKEIPGYQKGNESLVALKEFMPEDEWQVLDKGFKQMANAFLQEGSDKIKTELALAVEAKSLKTILETRQSDNAEVERLSVKLTNLYDNLANIANPLDILDDKFAFDTFVTWRQSKLLEQAKKKGLQLEASLENKIVTLSKDKDAWTSIKGEAPDILKSLNELSKSPCKGVDQRSKAAASKIKTSEVSRLEDQRDWAQLNLRLEEAKKLLPELQQRHRGYDGMGKQREEAQKVIEQKRKTLMSLIEQYNNAVNDQCQQNGVPNFDSSAEFLELIDGVLQAWEKAMVTASSEQYLEYSKLFALADLGIIEAKIKEANTPAGIQQAIGESGQDLAQKEFVKAWAEFEGLQLQSQSLDNTTAKQLAKQGVEVRKLAPPDWKAALAALTELNKKAAQDIQVASNGQVGLQKTIEKLGAEVLQEITLAKENSPHAKKFEGTFKALMEEHAELLLLGKSNNIDALNEAEQGLIDLKLRATKLMGAQDGQGVSLDKVVDLIEQAKKVLREVTKHLTENDPTALERLNQAWQTLEPEIFSMEPAVATEKLNEFMLRIASAKNAADKVVLMRNEYKDKLPRAKELLEEVSKSKAAPDYTKQLQARLKEIEKKASTPKTVVQALTSLKALIQDIFEVRTNRETALLKEKGVRQAQQDDEVLKKTYQHAQKICKDKYLKDAKAAVEDSDGDPNLPKELTRMLDAAEQTFDQGDVAKALEQVNLTIERAKQIVANPYGPSIGSRNDLPKDKQVWREAIQAFGQSLDVVSKKSLELAGDAPNIKKAVDTLDTMLKELKGRFDAMVFDTVVLQLMDEDADVKKRREAREAGLALVRGNQAILSKHPYVKKLLQNPVAKSEFSIAYRRMQSALNRLEANISRCVR